MRSAPFESNHVAHRSDRKVENEIHLPTVDLVNEVSPIGGRAPVGIEYGEIDRGVACACISATNGAET